MPSTVTHRISHQLIITCYLFLPLYAIATPLIQGELLECTELPIPELIKTSPVILKALGGRMHVDSEVDNFIPEFGAARDYSGGVVANDKDSRAILITLTPETIYKGASSLKLSKSADNVAESSFHYDGQLNATLEPLGCLDGSILELLPTEIIAFGKVVNDRPDILRISINGLHRWSPQFESRIWNYLGWDDWSDFALCSVTCGKGVQQRFRRCLLDNPSMMSNVNLPSEYFHRQGHESTANKANESNINSDEGSSSNIHEAQAHRGDNYTNNNLKKARRKKKKAKVLSTMSCEGYNIEQRNCNLFECSDDISDLLKFYRKPYTGDDLTTTSTTMPSTVTMGAVTSTASATRNTGFVSRWGNPKNFTIMITLKAKNITSPQSTIFSIRNSTQNLYIDQSKDGLRLYQERDETTEMLLIKFDLYDNRWHQISLSIQNGDFISIHVDCVWTSSYVVSKHLFSLPVNADAEIGRGFYGELQQLLILPGNFEKYQCSNVRTSINEVKRYIIDTFIDEDGT